VTGETSNRENRQLAGTRWVTPAVVTAVALAGIGLVFAFASGLHSAVHLPRALVVPTARAAPTPPTGSQHHHPTAPSTASAVPVGRRQQSVVTPHRPVVRDSGDTDDGHEARHDGTRHGDDGAGDE
jgi:hypothetical protein